MRERRWLAACGLALACGLPMAAAGKQDAVERLELRRQRLAALRERLQRMPERHRRLLSSGARNLMGRALVLERAQGRAGMPGRNVPTVRTPEGRGAAGASAAAAAIGPALLPAGRVSDPNADAVVSALDGFTQSETATAWCGNNVVIGYNDSGSYYESLSYGPGALSFNGVSRSTNRGARYADLGFPNPGTDLDEELIGSPALGCADQDTFYYASLHLDLDPVTPTTNVTVSRSDDAGATFADPVRAASQPVVTKI